MNFWGETYSAEQKSINLMLLFLILTIISASMLGAAFTYDHTIDCGEFIKYQNNIVNFDKSIKSNYTTENNNVQTTLNIPNTIPDTSNINDLITNYKNNLGSLLNLLDKKYDIKISSDEIKSLLDILTACKNDNDEILKIDSKSLIDANKNTITANTNTITANTNIISDNGTNIKNCEANISKLNDQKSAIIIELNDLNKNCKDNTSEICTSYLNKQITKNITNIKTEINKCKTKLEENKNNLQKLKDKKISCLAA